jgi:hypothetical protein
VKGILVGVSFVALACAGKAPAHDVANLNAKSSRPSATASSTAPIETASAYLEARPEPALSAASQSHAPAETPRAEDAPSMERHLEAWRSGGLGTGEGDGGRGEGACLCGDGRGHAKAPIIRQGAVAVSGNFPPEVVSRILRAQLGQFKRCYEQALAADPGATGSVRVAFTIDLAGDVVNARNDHSTFADAGMIECVVSVVSTGNFPAPEKPLPVVGTWTFEPPR